MFCLESCEFSIEVVIFGGVNCPGYVFSGEKEDTAVARELHGHVLALHEFESVSQLSP